MENKDPLGKHIFIGARTVIAFIVVEILQFTASFWALFIGGGTIQETLRQKGVGLKALFCLSAIQLIAAIALGIYFWAIRKRQEALAASAFKTETELVHGRHYDKQIVELDGRTFRECVFSNVTLLYHGRAAFQILNCRFTGPFKATTDNEIMKPFLSMLMTFLTAPDTIKVESVGRHDDLGRMVTFPIPGQFEIIPLKSELPAIQPPPIEPSAPTS